MGFRKRRKQPQAARDESARQRAEKDAAKAAARAPVEKEKAAESDPAA